MSTHIWSSAHEAWLKSDHGAAVKPLHANPNRHLLSRFAFGPSPHSLAQLSDIHADAWWARQIAYGKSHSHYKAAPHIAAIGTLLTHSPSTVRSYLKRRDNEYGWTAMDQLSQVTLGLQTWSPAQLYETVVDFFANHLNVQNHNGDVWNSRHTMDYSVIRKYAFGTFTDMLLASARNPAMLIYLNNTDSNGNGNGDNVNENYGRELLELHTVGVGNYTETDVRHSAYLMSGRRANVEIGAKSSYYFDPTHHYTAAVKVMGFSAHAHTAAEGQAVGDRYLKYLASHPATAKRLALKLCMRYVSDKPSAGLVAAVAKTYLAHKTAILPTLTAIFHSSEFWESRGRKVRRPTENLIATLRILNVHATDVAKATQTLSWMTSNMGNRPLEWPSPNGYPDVAEAWASSGTLLDEWEYHRGIAQNWWKSNGFSEVKLTDLFGKSKPTNSGAAVSVLTTRITGMTFSSVHHTALEKFLQERSATPIKSSKVDDMLPHLVPLILDSPYHAMR